MICASIKYESFNKFQNLYRKISLWCDLVEIRIDFLKDLSASPPDLRKITTHPFILTCRSISEGGVFKGTEKQRLFLLEKWTQKLQPDYVDIEYLTVKNAPYLLPRLQKNAKKVILSWHNMKNISYINYKKLLKQMLEYNTFAIKLAFMAGDEKGLLLVKELYDFCIRYKKTSRPIIIAMGDYGIPSRILYKKLGGYLTYGSVDSNEFTASGQLSVKSLKRIFRSDKITSHTALYALIGNPIKHSLSPSLFNTLFQKFNFRKVYMPLLCSDLKNLLSLIKAFNIHGLSITMPFKKDFSRMKIHRKYCHKTVKSTGITNTLKIKGNRFVFYNSDTIALRKIFTKIPLKNKDVLIIGSGGIARSAIYALKDITSKVYFTNRSKRRAKDLLQDFDISFIPLNRLRIQKTKKFFLIVNATPVGMSDYPQQKFDFIPSKIIKNAKVLMETIYSPLHTPFLKMSSENALKIYGDELFVYQAMVQFQLWTGKKITVKDCRKAIDKCIK